MNDATKAMIAIKMISAFICGADIEWRSYYSESDDSWSKVEHLKGLLRFLSDGDQVRVKP